MTQKQASILNMKMNLTLKAISSLPLFIASLHDKNPKKHWGEALKEWEKIEKQFKEILDYEYNNNSSGVKDQVS